MYALVSDPKIITILTIPTHKANFWEGIRLRVTCGEAVAMMYVVAGGGEYSENQILSSSKTISDTGKCMKETNICRRAASREQVRIKFQQHQAQ